MFMHIPLPEMWLVANNRAETGFNGNIREEVACSEMNSGLFMACLERGDIRAMVFGHDHVNDFTGEYCGITLAYDAGIEYDAYQDDDLRGGRMFVLDENDPRRFETYMVRVRDIMGTAGDRNPPRAVSADFPGHRCGRQKRHWLRQYQCAWQVRIFRIHEQLHHQRSVYVRHRCQFLL